MKNRKPLNDEEKDMLTSLFDSMQSASNYNELDMYSDKVMKFLTKHPSLEFEMLMKKENELYHARFDELHVKLMEGLKSHSYLKSIEEHNYHKIPFQIFKRKKR